MTLQEGLSDLWEPDTLSEPILIYRVASMSQYKASTRITAFLFSKEVTRVNLLTEQQQTAGKSCIFSINFN